MGCVGHVERIGEKRSTCRFWWGNLKQTPLARHRGRQCSGRCLTSRMEARDMKYFVSGLGQVSDFCEHGNEQLGSLKCGEFFVRVRNH
jgi:hypothetical protein